MATNFDEITLNFKGCYDVDSFVPNEAGIYCIYRAEYCGNMKVNLSELLYIGESHDIGQRLANHEHYDDWKRRLYYGEHLACSFAQVNSRYRERAEAAMIYVHKREYPNLINTSSTRSFNYGNTRIITTGVTNFLLNCFIVYSNGQWQEIQ